MAEPTPDRPRTINIDAEIDRYLSNLNVRIPATVLLFAVGVLIATCGALLRVYARKLAWPKEWSYSGDRANTDWAHAESLYSDFGMVTLLFGLALLLVGIVRATRPRGTA